MKMRTAILLGASLALLAIAAVPFAVHRAVKSRIGPQHVFELSESLPFLTEELALAKARDTLVKDGLDLAFWRPQPDGRTLAPDGRRDEFGARNTINSNQVVFAFTNGSTSMRFVSVELNGRQVVCQSSLGK
jgi:hypothetical protein